MKNPITLTVIATAIRATTPANWKEIFASAADDDLHSIVNGGRTMGNQIIQGRASSELRRREAVAAETTLDRGEKHAEKLTTRNLVWGFLIAVVGAVLGAVATWVLTPDLPIIQTV